MLLVIPENETELWLEKKETYLPEKNMMGYM